MKGLTIFFDTGPKWKAMLRVFKKTWEENMNIPLEVINATPPPRQEIYGLIANTKKLELWNKHFDDDTIFCDCDMMVRADITDGFSKINNLGYTVRKHRSRPFNAGVFFAKHSQYSREFMQEWVDVNRRFYKNEKLRRKWSKIVPGINQPALAYLLQDGWEVDTLSDIYNMCDFGNWKKAKMVHIKSKTRNTVFTEKESQLPMTYQREFRKLFWAHLGTSPEQALKKMKTVTVRKASIQKQRHLHLIK